MQTHIFIRTFFLGMSLNTNACPPGLFGPGCSQQCHCDTGETCNDGYCPCAKGWFGYQCQLLDLLYTDPNINITFNGVRRSHLETYSGVGPIVVSYPTLEHFTSLAIFTDLEGQLKKINLSYMDADNNLNFCEHLFISTIAPFFTLMRCDTFLLVKQLILSWDGVWKIQAFFLSGGMNFGFESLVVRNGGDEGYEYDPEKIKLAVDDNMSTCVTANQTENSSFTMELYMTYPQLVQKVLVYMGSDDVTQIGLHLSYVLVDGDRYLSTSDNMAQKHIFSLTKRLDFVSHLSLYMVFQPGDEQLRLRVCDILVLGDCPPNSYGPTCSSICFTACVNVTCDYLGICFECIEGWSGPRCDTKVPGGKERDDQGFYEFGVPISRKQDAGNQHPIVQGVDFVIAALFASVIMAIMTSLGAYVCGHVFLMCMEEGSFGLKEYTSARRRRKRRFTNAKGSLTISVDEKSARRSVASKETSEHSSDDAGSSWESRRSLETVSTATNLTRSSAVTQSTI